MYVQHATHPAEMAGLTTAALRERFVVPDLFTPGEIRLSMTHHDRLVIGGAVPAGGSLTLPTPDPLRAGYFCERRELAVICLDGSGTVTVDDTGYELVAGDVLYVGMGSRDVRLAGTAAYYLVSAPAHRPDPTRLARRDEVEALHLGTQAESNVRTIRKYVHAGGVASNQLVVGITTLAEGSVWNTMPCHVHDRRTEIYLYFGLGEDDRVVHLCGEPDNTRSLIMADRQAVVSPPWSVHSGAGTRAYSFVWAMAGENVDYSDVEVVPTRDLR
ncbi:5-dehydro-4-deoxy-D-glucuronate isomerase [Phytohabitans kaempferiae]|uniref:4-deoxy-L-threo-5-hexosulose-uronate ketol-isomerase n=1 Tax=Phytohabitans kaempferiae TaxID=1620943 RepID=A0ABV6LWP7_9ACTN